MVNFELIELLISCRLRNKFPQKKIKCIAQTAHVLYGDAKRYQDAGFDAFIGKPYKQEELIDGMSPVKPPNHDFYHILFY